ncbi:MAG: hypothetical protein ACRC4X_06280 [Cetobacterium sp.]
MKNKLTIYKPNELIEIVGNPISAVGLVTYNFLLHKFQNLKKDKIIISMSEIFNVLEISDNYDELFNHLDSLRNISVISRDSKGKLWGGFNLLSEFKKVGNGVFVQIPDTIFKALCGDENEKNLYYTTIKLLEQRIYKCSYTIIFYEIFKKYEKINIPIFNLEELKNITGTSDRYLEYRYFKRDVLTKSITEINKFDSKYNYSFEEKKIGRKVNEIKFSKVEKNTINISENLISENLEKAILKARKNRFIDDVYSAKAIEKLILKYNEGDIIKALNELYKYNSEIVNFSKILNSKIKDIVDSKKVKPKKEVIKVVKPKVEVLEKSELDLEKEKLSVLIFKIDLPTRERIMLFGELSVVEDLESLNKLRDKINSKI